MAASSVENPLQLTSESKTARKKKVRSDAVANGVTDTASVVSIEVPKENSTAAEADNLGEHPYIRELQKHVRSVSKKLSALHKTDAIIAENPGISLDDLVAQRKINTDQKASALKKPQLQAQLTQYEEQLEQYRKFDSDYQAKLNKQKEELAQEHLEEITKLKAGLQVEAAGAGDKELRQKLLIFSQFLRAAAAKRTIEEEADTDESRAFEGALLLVYGGDQKAVDTAVNIIEGASESVPSIEGLELPVTYAQVKQASISHAPFQTEAWIEQTAEATGADPTYDYATTAVDPTLANASLTELEQQSQEPVLPTESTAGGTNETSGNVAGERWDAAAAGASAEADKGGMEDSYEIIPRPSEEVDIPTQQQQPPQSTRWDEEPPTYESATGNKASEQWDVKAAGEQTDDGTWATSATQVAETIASTTNDGFHEVAGRQRGRGGGGGGRGRGGDGEFRGRGGRRGHFRGGRGGGDGEFRGRGGFRGGRGDGEFRGRGRGRGGPRGGAGAPPAPSS